MLSSGTSPDWMKTSQSTKPSTPTSTCHSVAHPTQAGSVDRAGPAAGGSTRSGRTTTCHLPICGDAQSDVDMGRHYGPGWLCAERRRRLKGNQDTYYWACTTDQYSTVWWRSLEVVRAPNHYFSSYTGFQSPSASHTSRYFWPTRFIPPQLLTTCAVCCNLATTTDH